MISWLLCSPGPIDVFRHSTKEKFNQLKSKRYKAIASTGLNQSIYLSINKAYKEKEIN